MSHINLLPWRENYKKQKQVAFYILLACSCLVTLMLCYGVKLYIDSMSDAQNERNQFLQTQTIVLDRRIAEIRTIKEQKAELVRRINLIQQLEQQRNLITRFFNTLPIVTPSGVYINSVTFKNGLVDIKGVSESTGRVSAMVRRVDNTGWLGDAALPSIVSGAVTPIKLYNFSMNSIVLPEKDDKNEP
jgi:type IV pilus assembly protein PilN